MEQRNQVSGGEKKKMKESSDNFRTEKATLL